MSADVKANIKQQETLRTGELAGGVGGGGVA